MSKINSLVTKVNVISFVRVNLIVTDKDFVLLVMTEWVINNFGMFWANEKSFRERQVPTLERMDKKRMLVSLGINVAKCLLHSLREDFVYGIIAHSHPFFFTSKLWARILT